MMASSCMNRVRLAILLFIGGHLVGQAPCGVFGVSPGSYDKLTREQFLQLDKDVTDAYELSFNELDYSNTTYDGLLFRLLRAYRHSIVVHLFDFKYSNRKLMEQSRGSQVDKRLCQQQLGTLVNIAKAARRTPENYGFPENGSIPFSAINFLETSGRTESGVINGNCNWFGSYSGCTRAKIPANSARKYLPPTLTQEDKSYDIVGRYCMAHLKARSWPKWDIYYEDRVSIKVGVCLPESCHSLEYSEDESIRSSVDYLARSSLSEPFNGDRYFIDHLFCLPDKSSPARQFDLGAKLFLAFCSFWALILLYANLRYSLRMRQLKKLNQITELVDDYHQVTSSRPPSASAEQNQTHQQVQETGFDFVKAFSIMSNLEFLFRTKFNDYSIKDSKISSGHQSMTRLSNGSAKQSSAEQSISLVTTGSRCNDDDGTTNDKDSHPPQATSAPPPPPPSSSLSKIHTRKDKRRVNLDILDGIKCIAIFGVVMGHTMMEGLAYHTDTKILDTKMFDLAMIITINTLQVVSLFYLITGILVTYLAFTKAQKPNQLMQPGFWVLVLVSRYLRLIPAYFLVFWFSKHMATYTGSGIHWPDYRTDEEYPRTYCSNESWLTMLTLSASDIKIPNGCLPHAWYLTADFRCLFIIPFYIILLAWNKSYGYGAIAITFVVTFWRNIKLMQSEHIDWSLTLLHLKAHSYSVLVDRSHYSYTDVFFRLSTCLMGVMIGHLLYLYETRQIKQWPRWFRSYGLKFAMSQVVLSFVGGSILAIPFINKHLPSYKQIDSNYVAATMPILKASMEIYFSIILLLLTTGGGFAVIRKLLSCRLAKVLAAISYCVFLVHVDIMYKSLALKTDHFYSGVAFLGLFFLVTSNVAAFFIHLLYEMPLHNLTRYYLKKSVARGA